MTESLAPAFITGVASSLGPCAAPRYLIVAAIGFKADAESVTLFVIGSLGGYAILVCAGAGLTVWMSGSRLVYIVLALSLMVAAIKTLASNDTCDRHCLEFSRSWGATLCLGASTTMLGAPCCLPIWLALGMQTAFAQTWFAAVLILCVFALGHVSPLAAAVALKASFPAGAARWRDATALMGGSLLAATAIFFALLE